MKSNNQAERNSPLTQLWEYSIAARARLCLPSPTRRSCCTVSARPNVLMEQQFCVSLLCKLFWQSLYIPYTYMYVYMKHVCCPIDRQIAPLISQAALRRVSPCRAWPCRVRWRQCHISVSSFPRTAMWECCTALLFRACKRLQRAAYADQTREKPHSKHSTLLYNHNM